MWEIDIVGADRAPIARRLHFVGAVKWLNSAFEDHDLASLQRQRSRLTDELLPLLAVSRSGVSCEGLAATTYGPEDLIAAW
jgi:hypothetical protein